MIRDQGFTFDTGPTVMTAPHCIEELFAAAGKRMSDAIELLPVTPFYRLLWSDGEQFEYTGDLERTLEQIRARNPADVAGYQRFLEYSRAVFEQGYVELAAKPFSNLRDMLKVAPQLVRLRADRSVYRTVSRFVRDPHLREAFSFHTLLVGGNPFETSSIYTLIHYLERNWGVFYPRGGTGALVAALVGVFLQLGGKLLLCTPVDRIEIGARAGRPAHRVHARGQCQTFDLVVSNADLHHTYASLLRGSAAAARTASACGHSTGRCRCSSCTSEPTAAIATASHTIPCCSGRATAACSTTSSAAAACPTTSVCTCTRRV